MNEMFPDALIPQGRYSQLFDTMTNHPKDRHVLAAAIIADADVVVTKDIGDFRRQSAEPYNIEVQTPDQFVRTQAALGPGLFMEVFFELRACQRNRLAIQRSKASLSGKDIALFLRAETYFDRRTPCLEVLPAMTVLACQDSRMSHSV